MFQGQYSNTEPPDYKVGKLQATQPRSVKPQSSANYLTQTKVPEANRKSASRPVRLDLALCCTVSRAPLLKLTLL